VVSVTANGSPCDDFDPQLQCTQHAVCEPDSYGVTVCSEWPSPFTLDLDLDFSAVTSMTLVPVLLCVCDLHYLGTSVVVCK
jgi:hypothetical protein